VRGGAGEKWCGACVAACGVRAWHRNQAGRRAAGVGRRVQQKARVQRVREGEVTVI